MKKCELIQVSILVGILLILMWTLTGCARKPQRLSVTLPPAFLADPSLPSPDGDGIFARQMKADKYLAEKKADLLTDLQDRPDLTEQYTNPALKEIEELEKMTVLDPGYADKLNQLHSDMNHIYDMEGNDTAI